jgi:hypothetical protein
MRNSSLLFVTALALLLLPGCASLERQDPNQTAQFMEPMLEAAGFQRLPANSPEKMAHLKTLTPLQLMKHKRQDGTRVYSYADPYYCQCLYVGNWKAFERVQKDLAQQDAVRSEQYQAMMDDDVEPDTEFDPMTDPFGPFAF